MSWIRQNSFLAAFFAFTTVCAIALAVVLYLQYDSYSTVAEEYGKQASELKRLQALPLYPSEANLGKLRIQKQSLDEGIAKLQTQLVKMALPVEASSPEQFQDKLRASVLATAEMAKQNGVKLPEKFYLGFEIYQNLPPRREATLALAKQLAGIELFFKFLIDNRITLIDSVKRSILVEEEQKGSPQQASKVVAAQNGPVQKTPFEITFKAEQNQLRKILNSVVQSDTQFFIIRALQIKNEKAKAPSKRNPEENRPAPATPESGNPAGNEAGSSLKFILGTEKIDVAAQIEILDFKVPARK